MDFSVTFKVILLISLSRAFANPLNQNSTSPNLRITGGRSARLNEFPYQVALFLRVGNGFRFFCGGSVYNRRFIVTAAHCLQQGDGTIREPTDLRVLVGELDISDRIDASQEFSRGLLPVLRVHSHPQFSVGDVALSNVSPSRTFSLINLPRNDIGLLELRNILIFSDSVRPIRIADRNEVPTGPADASGWGYTNTIFLQTPDEPRPPLRETIPLKTIQVNVYPRVVCAARYGSMVTESWLCLGSLFQFESTCNGDSGGPYSCRRPGTGERYLCGIISNGQGCGLPLTPSFGTDVSKFYDYIRGIAGPQ